jgi:hypothetical protein
MALDSLVRSAVAIANSVTSSLQVVVSHEAWIGSDSYGAPQYATAVNLSAIVEYRQRLRHLRDGQQVLQRAVVFLLEPVSPNGAAERREPIDPRDRIVLPDGTTGPIYDVAGLADPQTNASYYHEVVIGDVGAD